MAVAIIAEIPGGTAEMDAALRKEVRAETTPPQGMLLRLAGPMDGGWRIVSVWESQDAYDKFRRETLIPALQKLGRQVGAPQVWRLHEMQVAKEAALPH